MLKWLDSFDRFNVYYFLNDYLDTFVTIENHSETISSNDGRKVDNLGKWLVFIVPLLVSVVAQETFCLDEENLLPNLLVFSSVLAPMLIGVLLHLSLILKDFRGYSKQIGKDTVHILRYVILVIFVFLFFGIFFITLDLPVATVLIGKVPYDFSAENFILCAIFLHIFINIPLVLKRFFTLIENIEK